MDSDRRPSRVPQGRLVLNRGDELLQLRRALDDTQCGHGQVVLVAGEPGIGKTTLAREFSDRSIKHGSCVLWGRSGDREGSPPYWPWAEALRALAAYEAGDDQPAFFGPGASHISLILPELREKLLFKERSTLADDESDRFRLGDAVRALLQRMSRQRSIVLVLEDLHWADQGSLFLLEFIAQDIATHPLLVVATYRDGEVSAPLGRTLGELSRLGARRIALGGLTRQCTARLMRAVAGRRPEAQVVQAVHTRTDGNPFFVTEIARLHTRDTVAVPDNVRAAILKQLNRLSALANQTLVAAAVIGREFDFPLLNAALSEVGEADLLGAVDDGLQALVIEPLPSRGQEWYQFRHPLIRDALYESVPPSRRARWHATIARAMEQLLGDRDEGRAGELARHATCASVLVEPAMIAKYSSIAGGQLLAAHAFEEALGHFERAWRAREALPFDAEAAGTLVGLGCAQAATALRWNRQQGWMTLRRAIDYYLEAGDISRAVAIAVHPCITAEGATDVGAILRQILDIVPRGSTNEGWLVGRLGAALYFETGDYQAAQAAFTRALGIAATEREAGLELRTLAYSSSVDHFHLRWREVLANSRRVRELAQRVDDLHSETYAGYRVAYALMQTGCMDEAALEAEASLSLAERLKDHGKLADTVFVSSVLAQLRGQWHAARVHSDRGLALSPNHLALLHARVLLEYETGNRSRGDTYLRRLLTADGLDGPYPLAGVYAAMVLSQAMHLLDDTTGRDAALSAARAVLRRRSSILLTVVTTRICCGLVAAHRGARADCEEELEYLTSYGRMILVPGLVTHRVLGLLAHGAGQPQRAAAHFEEALAFCQSGGYRPELAWSCYQYARVLLDAGRRAERQRAAALIEEASALAAQLGLVPLADSIHAFRQRYGLRLERKPAGLSNRELEILALLSQGRTNKEIADTLCISTNTVALHVARVLGKTGSSNRTEAAAFAMRHHLVGATQA